MIETLIACLLTLLITYMAIGLVGTFILLVMAGISGATEWDVRFSKGEIASVWLWPYYLPRAFFRGVVNVIRSRS